MKLILRRLLKRKSYTLINISGLSLGIMCSIILFLMIQSNLGVDGYHEKKDRIYRVVSYSTVNGNPDHNPGVPIPMIEAFQEEFPEAEIVAPVSALYGGRFFVGEKVYEHYENIVYVDERLYNMLDRRFIHGNNNSAFYGPNKVVLSQKLALKFFGKEDIVGEQLTLEGVGDLEITGVIEDFPKLKTDFPFDILVSYETFLNLTEDKDNWGSTSSDFQCYVLFKDEFNIETVESRLPAFADKYYGEERNDERINRLQPLSDLHFNENYSNYSYHTVSKVSILTMAILAVFLLLTACINFINLSTAQASERLKEIGIRKVLGNTKSKIIWSVLWETSFITMISLIIAVGLTELSLIKINEFLEVELSISYLSFDFIFFVAAIALVVSLVSGLYPAIIVSKFQPASILKGDSGSRSSFALILRKSLVVFQFVISQVLIIGTVITQSQLNYFENLPVGFQKEGIINIDLPDELPKRKKSFQVALQQISSVDNVSLMFGPPAWGGISITNFYYNLGDEREELNAEVKPADYKYIDVFDIKLLAGKSLPESDTVNKILINESFLRTMGRDEPAEVVGELLNLWGNEVEIVGVVNDFHTKSFRDAIDPVALYTDFSSYRSAAVKVSTSQVQRTVEDLETVFKEFYPGYEFQYGFMDETLAEFYDEEKKMGEMLMIFSLISIFIGCLGLYGLVSYMANRKVKEIGIRKALGASVSSILGLFSKEFGVLIVIAFIIAAPLSYYGMNLWLQEFQYRVEMNPLMFISGIMLTVLVAAITISYKSLRASFANPVDALRNE